MTTTKQNQDEHGAKRKQAPARKREAELRIATLVKQEKLPQIEARGLLAAFGLNPGDKMTRSAFQRRILAWRKHPAGKEMR